MTVLRKKLYLIMALSVLTALLAGSTLGYCCSHASLHSPEDCPCFLCQTYAADASTSEVHILYLFNGVLALSPEVPLSPYLSEIFHPPLT